MSRSEEPVTFEPKRLFTPDEAERMLPLVRRITADIAETYQRLMDNSELAGSASPEEARGLDNAHREELSDLFDRIEADKQRFGEYVEELEKLGVLLKGPLDGLVDFPALKDGHVVFLCWKSGEPSIGHWHEIEDGFSGRQPLRREEFARDDLPAVADKELAGRIAGESDPRKDKKWNSTRSC